ncbi:hypothetical protein CCMA1212_001662 [Trichoderma ghanense]|uniref:Uncharacterized protein n=1 Tax=Trichoderma ghanense TaxID=65468 RepID=A0ABY2HB82_9HYPO
MIGYYRSVIRNGEREKNARNGQEWVTRYHFTVESKRRSLALGEITIDLRFIRSQQYFFSCAALPGNIFVLIFALYPLLYQDSQSCFREVTLCPTFFSGICLIHKSIPFPMSAGIASTCSPFAMSINAPFASAPKALMYTKSQTARAKQDQIQSNNTKNAKSNQ